MAQGRGAAAIEGFDLFDPATFANGHPHHLYDALRVAEPVYRHPRSAQQPPFWALTRHADIAAVSLDGEHFTSTMGFRLQSDNRAAMDPQIGAVLRRFMLAMDPPEHGRFRALVMQAFTPAALRPLEARIAAAVADVLARAAEKGAVEFVSDIAAPVPIKTVCAILGVPPEDEDKVFRWTNSIFGTDDPDYAVDRDEANRNYLEVFDYAAWAMAERRRAPRDDLLTVIAHARIDGAPISDIEQKSFFSNLLAAGNETTRSSFAGAVWLLSQNPGERARLIAEPALLPGAINELLRVFSPVYQMARTTKADVTVGGRQIRAGERVVMLYGAGNHDPAVFEEPHRPDASRANAARHITFGIGAHHCLGSRLAQMQLRILLSALLERFPAFAVTGPPVYLASNFVAAMKALPVRLRP